MKSLKALAAELGVSTAAVSYVYHGKWKEKRISAALAARIREALDREGVRPSLAGIQLKTGRSMSVGVLLPDFETPHWLDILKGVESVTTPASLIMLVANTRLGLAESETLLNVVSRGVDGLIMAPHSDAARFKEEYAILGREVPLVFVDTYLRDAPNDFVVTDNRGGATQLVKDMLSQGRKRVAYLGTAKHLSATSERFDGYAEALRQCGFAVDPSLVKRNLLGCEGVAETLASLFALPNPPDSLFVESLSYFKEGFAFLSDRGIKVPDDISLAGFDIFEPAWIETPCIDISSILRAEQDGETIGRLAAERLRMLVDRKNELAPGRLEHFVAPKWIGPGKAK